MDTKSLSWRILRRLARFGLAWLLVASAVLWWTAREHVRAEANGGALAGFLAEVERVRGGDEAAVAELAAMRLDGRIRHLDFDLQRAGRTLLPPVAAHGAGHAARIWQVGWTDAAGRPWTLQLRSDPRAELAELASDAAVLSMLALGLAALLTLGVVRSVRAETAPLGALTAAIAAYARGDFTARTHALNVREFDTIGRALNALADALQQARDRAQRLSRQLVQAEDAHNRWIARELHDELGQWLTAARAEAAFLRVQARGAAREAAESIERALAETVVRVRVVLERLRPHAFQDDPLPAAALEHAVRELVAGWQARHSVGATIDLRLDLDTRTLPNAVAMAAYRVVQEGLSNAMRHARTRRVATRLTQRGTTLEVVIEDDGAGTGTDTSAPATTAPGRGLAGLAERVGSLGGTLHAGPQAAGWRVHACLPCPAAPQAA